MNISRVEYRITPNHIQRITTKIAKNTHIRIGEDIIDGTTRYKEVISQGWTFFRRAIMSYDKNGKRIDGSKFTEVIKGDAARNRKVNSFGVYV